jgi:ParB family chromosome partitioning protein
MDDHQFPVPEGAESAPLNRRRLGRGLTSLISGTLAAPDNAHPEVAAGSGGVEYLWIEESLIGRNPFQPRQEFDGPALEELVESVRQHGILQPLIVRSVEGGYQLVAGERRLIAARKAGLARVPCHVVVLDDRGACEVAIVENIQRTDLGDLEKAQAFAQYLEKFGGTIEELARKLGKDRSTVNNWLRLLELPDFVKLALNAGRITAGHARALLPLDEEAEQIAFCQRIQSESMSVRQTEEAVREQLERREAGTIPFEGAGSRGKSRAASVSPHVRELERQLRELLGVPVQIRLKGKASGRLIIPFATNDDFERIVGFLRKAS